MKFTTLAFSALALGTTTVFAALKAGECEVCIGVVSKFIAEAKTAGASSSPEINKVIKNVCKDLVKRENRFCYYIGGTEDAATTIINEVSKPMTYSMPAEKICEKLKPKDAQICDLSYEKQLDWANINLEKMRVKALRKILNDWNEDCKGCVEKPDFIKRIKELKPKYVREEL